jgi:hypothetical protein
MAGAEIDEFTPSYGGVGFLPFVNRRCDLLVTSQFIRSLSGLIGSGTARTARLKWRAEPKPGERPLALGAPHFQRVIGVDQDVRGRVRVAAGGQPGAVWPEG